MAVLWPGGISCKPMESTSLLPNFSTVKMIFLIFHFAPDFLVIIWTWRGSIRKTTFHCLNHYGSILISWLIISRLISWESATTSRTVSVGPYPSSSIFDSSSDFDLNFIISSRFLKRRLICKNNCISRDVFLLYLLEIFVKKTFNWRKLTMHRQIFS